MRYTVTWSPTARAELADIWRLATDRKAVSRACDWVDFYLKDDPETKATPTDNFFGLRVDPLRVLAEVRPEDRVVEICQVDYVGKEAE